MIGACTPDSIIGMMFVTGTTTMNIFTGFLYLLEHELRRQIYAGYNKVLILFDGASIHMGKDVTRF